MINEKEALRGKVDYEEPTELWVSFIKYVFDNNKFKIDLKKDFVTPYNAQEMMRLFVQYDVDNNLCKFAHMEDVEKFIFSEGLMDSVDECLIEVISMCIERGVISYVG